jgi:alpha-tubulin suppressor-like RCC1 family protein
MARPVLVRLLVAFSASCLCTPALADTAVAVSAGQYHTCVLTSSGGVSCWGDPAVYGALPWPPGQPRPLAVRGLDERVTAVIEHGWDGCAITRRGRVKCWEQDLAARDVEGLPDAVTALAMGSYIFRTVSGRPPAPRQTGLGHRCAVTRDGGVLCWGDNAWGQLGDGTASHRSTPAPVAGLTSAVVALAAGSGHTCALTAAGTLACWGNNTWGRLGDGTTTNRPTPVAVTGLTSRVVEVTAAGGHTCALTAEADVVCWGLNVFGQLGDGTTTNRPTPVVVTGLPANPTHIAAGGGAYRTLAESDEFYVWGHTCAVMSAGTLHCWGANHAGQLGNGSTAEPTMPTEVTGLGGHVIAVSGGQLHTCAVTREGTVECWGAGDRGQLGDGAAATRPTPATVPSLEKGVAAIEAGYAHTCVVSASGLAACWGSNSTGQLGDGTKSPRVAPTLVTAISGRVTAVAAGGPYGGRGHTCAVTTDTSLLCWGYNSLGQLGDTTYPGRGTPMLVPGLATGARAVTAGGEHTCALRTDGTVLCWGDNFYGQVGDGTTPPRFSPTPVTGLGAGQRSVAAGDSHTCAVTHGGAVSCWGSNWAGQLGDATTTPRFTPTPVSGLDGGVAEVAAGGSHTCALTSGGAVVCWGDNTWGQLGDGTTTARPTPVPVVGLDRRLVAVAAGDRHTCAVTAAGAVMCWGANASGQLGDGTTSDRAVPVLAMTGLGARATAVTAGGQHTCAVTDGGAARCWGDSSNGALGDGTVPLGQSSAPVPVLGFGGAATHGYFAEGATSAFFSTRLALVNPGERPANTWLSFQRRDGSELAHFIAMPPRSRRTVDPVDFTGMAGAEFATTVASTEPLVADRTMTWGDTAHGTYGAHTERLVPDAATTWYLAEGATHSGFDLFYLVLNPSTTPADVRVTFLRPAPAAPLVRDYTVAPASRFTVWVNYTDPQLAATDVAAVVTSTNDVPVVVERAMYQTRAGLAFSAGHESAGVTQPATEWFLAEGATGEFFDLFVLVANPTGSDAEVEAMFLLPDGRTVEKRYRVGASSRFNIWVDHEDAALADTAVSTIVRSTNEVPLIVERAMWWPGSAWHEAHNSPGATTTGPRWAVADGEVDAARNLDTYLLVANTAATPAEVRVTLLFEDGTEAVRTFAGLAPKSRFNVPVGYWFPEAAGRRFGAIVESLGPNPAPIVVERAMYWDAAGQRWAAGTNALATKLP